MPQNPTQSPLDSWSVILGGSTLTLCTDEAAARVANKSWLAFKLHKSTAVKRPTADPPTKEVVCVCVFVFLGGRAWGLGVEGLGLQGFREGAAGRGGLGLRVRFRASGF